MNKYNFDENSNRHIKLIIAYGIIILGSMIAYEYFTKGF